MITSHTVDIRGPVHYVEFGAPDRRVSGPPMLLIHGLGGSHVNWLTVGPELAEHRRVVALDLIGFGQTRPHGRLADVRSQRRLIDRFLDEVIGEPAIVMGNSMGGFLSLVEAVASPQKIAGLVLVDPAMARPLTAGIDAKVAGRFAAYAVPVAGTAYLRRRYGRLGAKGMVDDTLDICMVDRSLLREDVYRAHIEAAERRMGTPWAGPAFLAAARTLVASLANPYKFRSLIARVQAPTLLIHGTHDRLVPLQAAREAARQRPDWTLHVMRNVGHVPQLERPDEFLSVVEAWLADQAEQRAA